MNGLIRRYGRCAFRWQRRGLRCCTPIRDNFPSLSSVFRANIFHGSNIEPSNVNLCGLVGLPDTGSG